MNTAHFLGRVTKDIEILTTQSGNHMTRIDLAINRPKDKNGEIKTDFVPLVAFGKTAEILAQYVSKGDQIQLTARYNTYRYNDNDTGKERTGHNFMVESFSFVSSPKKAGDSQQPQQRPAPQQSQAQQRPAPQQSQVQQRPAPQQQPQYQKPVEKAPEPQWDDEYNYVASDDLPF